jgi:hypothetical protein
MMETILLEVILDSLLALCILCGASVRRFHKILNLTFHDRVLHGIDLMAMAFAWPTLERRAGLSLSSIELFLRKLLKNDRHGWVSVRYCACKPSAPSGSVKVCRRQDGSYAFDVRSISYFESNCMKRFLKPLCRVVFFCRRSSLGVTRRFWRKQLLAFHCGTCILVVGFKG